MAIKTLDFSQIYVKFRGSVWFLVILVVFCAAWMAIHWITKFDPDLGLLNIVLSFEASLSLAFFAMVSEFQYREQKKQTETIQQILERMDQRDEKIMEVVEDIHEEVDGHDSAWQRDGD
jgi:uncharacterized membrane protein